MDMKEKQAKENTTELISYKVNGVISMSISRGTHQDMRVQLQREIPGRGQKTTSW